MKTLLVCAQDIRTWSLGVVEEGKLVHERYFDTAPEEYLKGLDETLAMWQLAPTDFSAVAVVAGPGAFTASRVSIVMANAFAFASAIPVIPLENAQRLSLADLAVSLPSTRSVYAIPVYDREPNITQASK